MRKIALIEASVFFRAALHPLTSNRKTPPCDPASRFGEFYAGRSTVDPLDNPLRNPARAQAELLSPARSEQRQARKTAPQGKPTLAGIVVANPPIGLSQLFPSASEQQYKVGELLSFAKESGTGPDTTPSAAGSSTSAAAARTSSAPPERPKPRVKSSKSERKKAGERAQQAVAVDLKAELRSESVKAFSSSSVTMRAGKGGGPESPAPPTAAVKRLTVLGNAPGTVPGDGGKAARGGEDAGGVGGDGAAVARMEDSTAVARAALDALDFGRVSEQAKDAAAQV